MASLAKLFSITVPLAFMLLIAILYVGNVAWIQTSVMPGLLQVRHEESLPTVTGSFESVPSGRLGSANCKELCDWLLKSTKGSIPVRQDFLEECYQLVCSVSVNAALWQILEKIKDYVRWVQNIDRILERGEVKIIFNSTSEIKWMHVRRREGRSMGTGCMVGSMRIAFLLSIFSGRFFLADFGSFCNDTIHLWRPNAIPWKVTEKLDQQLQIRKGSIERLGCHTAFSKAKVLTVYANVALDSSEKSLCIATLEEMRLFRQLPQDDRIHVFLSALLTYLLIDFAQSENIFTKAEAFKVENGVPRKYASMHIRTGSFSDGRIEHRTRLSTSKESWSQQIQCAFNLILQNAIDFPLVLITDSNDLKDFVKKRFGNSKVVSTDIRTAHQYLPVGHITLNRCEEINTDAMVDLWLMANSQFFILSTSTFSALSANIGLIPYQQQSCCANEYKLCYQYPIIRH